MGKTIRSCLKEDMSKLELRDMEKIHPSHEQEEQATALLTKYGDKKLTDLQSQKKMYWLLIDQIIPSRPITSAIM
jgi:hypothetical protein